MPEVAKNPWAAKLKTGDAAKPAAVNPTPAPATKLGAMFPAAKPKYPVIDAKPEGSVIPSVSTKSRNTLDALDDIDLSDLENMEDPGIPPLPKPVGFKSNFDDETPATKPTRELPEDLDKNSMQFIDLIDGVYGILDDPELLGGVIRNIMIELKSNVQYIKLVAPEDIRTWVRAMRDSMGLARIKKTEAKSTRGTGAKAKKDNIASKLLDSMDDIGEW
jgi:hypothetical protein